jgi:RNA polymerase sigma factor (sigma-70 family)
VDRHKKLVYWTCRRDIGDAQLAEDAAQAVFITLAQKAATIRKDASLAGWLFMAARHVSRSVRDAELRRRRSEERAALHMQSEVDTDAAWEQVEPLLNDALSSLSGQDRTAVLLRFCEGYSFPEIAETLGATEEPSRKRVARSLERLRSYLGRKEVSVASAALAALLTEHAANAVPDNCTIMSGKAILAAASDGVTHATNAHTGSLLIKKGATILMDATIKKAVIAGGIILLLGGGGIAVTAMKHHAQASQAAAAFGQRTLYTVTDLGTLPGFSHSMATSINNKGEIFGAENDPKGSQRPFYYHDGAMHGIAMPPGYSSGSANRINDRGMILGYGYRMVGPFASLLGSKDGLTVYTPPTPMQKLTVAAVNDKGVITGWYQSADGTGDAATCFVLNDGNFGPIPTTTGLADVFGINNNGDILERKIIQGFHRACIYSQGKITLPPIPAGYPECATGAINDRGDVAASLSQGRHLQFRDHVNQVGLGWNINSKYGIGSVSASVGTRQDKSYRFLTFGQGYAISRMVNMSLSVNRLDLGAQHITQTVFSPQYLLDAERSIGGRIVSQGRNTNIFASFGQKVRSGSDIYLLFGDPNSPRTRGGVQMKVVSPF